MTGAKEDVITIKSYKSPLLEEVWEDGWFKHKVFNQRSALHVPCEIKISKCYVWLT